MANIETYNHKEIENKARVLWSKTKIKTDETQEKPKAMIVEMFPYPSGDLHMGHLLNYTLGDVIARFKIAKGFNVLHPQGWDAFGLPAENAARLQKLHPMDWTYANIDQMNKQLRSLGMSYNWDRTVTTCDCSYYVHEQRLFIQMLENGMAYQKDSWVNWDPVDQTVLANEQVIDGKGMEIWRKHRKKKLKQWFLKITDYAERLLNELESLKWPEKIKIMQSNWIGRNRGFVIDFQIYNQGEKIEVFTAKIENIIGTKFIGISPDHPLIDDYWATLPDATKEIIKTWRQEYATQQSADPSIANLSIKAINPITNDVVGIYVANFVTNDFGTGAILGCPAHNERDRKAADSAQLTYSAVIRGIDGFPRRDEYSDEDFLMHSGKFNNLTIAEARTKFQSILQANNAGKETTYYRLKDWGISRQRYWGCPIPIIKCEKCGNVPVPDHALPVTLPYQVSFDFKGNPLESNEEWLNVKCPKCGDGAIRETDTFDTFFESSWYFIAYCNSNGAMSDAGDKYWMPVDYYIGGVEHAILHLLYARYITKVMFDFKMLSVEEPFNALFAQGMVCHKTYKNREDGSWLSPIEAEKMDPSLVVECGIEKNEQIKKNTIRMQDAIEKYGADVSRFFILSNTPPSKDIEWSNRGAEATYKFIANIWKWLKQVSNSINNQEIYDINQEAASKIAISVYSTAKKIGEYIENFQTNLAISKIHVLKTEVTKLSPQQAANPSIREVILAFIRILEPFTPHLSQVAWSIISGNENELIKNQPWPTMPDNLQEPMKDATIAVQINGKTRGTIAVEYNATEANVINLATNWLCNKYKKPLALEEKRVIFVKNKIINFVDK